MRVREKSPRSPPMIPRNGTFRAEAPSRSPPAECIPAHAREPMLLSPSPPLPGCPGLRGGDALFPQPAPRGLLCACADG